MKNYILILIFVSNLSLLGCYKASYVDSRNQNLKNFSTTTNKSNSVIESNTQNSSFANLLLDYYFDGSPELYLSFDWENPEPPQYVYVSVYINGNLYTNYTMSGNINPYSTNSSTFTLPPNVADGSNIKITVSTLDGQSASANYTLNLSSSGGGGGGNNSGFIPQNVEMNVARTPNSSQTGTSYNFNVYLSWTPISINPGQPNYGEKVYGCVKLIYNSYDTTTIYPYCTTDNAIYNSNDINEGFLSFIIFDHTSNNCKLPISIAYYWETKPFIPDTVRADRFKTVVFPYTD